jgi:adenylate kinase
VALDILLLGPQGSGKGTQAKRIAADYEVPHIATGDMLRQAMADGSELGRRVKPLLDAGDLVPDELMIELIRERLAADDAREGFVLDGFPRTAGQAEALDAMLAELGRGVDVVFDLRVHDEATLFARMQKRSTEEGRTDDTPKAIQHRLELYREQTAPLVERYRSTRGNVVGVHADRSVGEVFAEIQRALDQVAVR